MIKYSLQTIESIGELQDKGNGKNFYLWLRDGNVIDLLKMDKWFVVIGFEGLSLYINQYAK